MEPSKRINRSLFFTLGKRSGKMLPRSEDQCCRISLQVANSFIASTKYFSFSRSYIPKVSCSLVSCYFSAVSECTIIYFHVSQIQCLMTCNKRAKTILQSTARTYIITAWLEFFHIKSQVLTTFTRKNTAFLQKEASPVLDRGISVLPTPGRC